jgi:hypothetical protein
MLEIFQHGTCATLGNCIFFFLFFLNKNIGKIDANYTLVKSLQLSQAQLGSLPSVWYMGPEFTLHGWVGMALPWRGTPTFLKKKKK